MADKRLNGTRVLMVIAPSEFRDEELLEPKKVLESEGAQVTVASTRAGEATGMLGARVTPDVVLEGVKSADYQGIAVVGGMGSPEFLWENKQLHTLLQEFNRDQKVVAAICLSGAALAKAGVLQNRRATVYAVPESLSALEDGKATYVTEHVVQDAHCITADGPEAATEFGQRIAEQLSKVAHSVG